MEFKDRVANKPNRVKLTYEDNNASVYATVELADEPIEEGTPLNAANMNKLLNKENNDYIVESGNQDGWIYRKWNSGFVECFKEARVTSASDYSDNVALMRDYLPFEINSAIANVSGGQWQTWGSVIRMVHTNGVYVQAFMECVNPVSSNFCWFYISVMGRWK